MNKIFNRYVIKSRLSKVLYFFVAYLSAIALCNAQTADDYNTLPPLLADNATPLVMLALSNDHQLWWKAYTDYTDLDGDGAVDTTYTDSFDYYGYFSSDHCYEYQTGVTANNYSGFVPTASVDSGGGHKCASSSGTWSGNFLNWATMTRMDIVRKVLYGGLRIFDTASVSGTPGVTILQRAMIPDDNHAFVKIVDESKMGGDLISDFTPITGQTVVSLCNVTDHVNGPSTARAIQVTPSAGVDNPPVLKVASGRHFAWSGSEVRQCRFRDESGTAPYSPTRANVSGLGTTTEFHVRVQACVDGQDRDACRFYQDSSGLTTYKPAGILQAHGETGDVKFGLITGSYVNNKNGGVLRKNIGFLGNGVQGTAAAEIDMTSGAFVNQTTSDDGIINTLNRLRIQGWNFSISDYDDCTEPGISVTDFKSPSTTQQCKDWGNPISEIYLEALRYFAGLTTAAFGADDSTVIAGLDPVAWVDPMSTDEYCANCSIVVLSTGLNNFDGDQLSSASDITGLSAALIDTTTDAIGNSQNENLNGSPYMVANEPGGGGTANICDAKTISNLSSVAGMCPEMPSLEGSYKIGGLAYYAHENDLRQSASYPEPQTVETFTVALAESLPSFEITTTSGNTVNFVPLCQANSTGGAAPGGTGWRDCSIVDVTIDEKIITPRVGPDYEYGRLIISWEDSTWGNDYDMDGYQVIEYCTAVGDAADINNNNGNNNDGDWCPNFTADANALTPMPTWQDADPGEIQFRVSNIGASAGHAMRFGYVISGTNGRDGTYIDIHRRGGYNFIAEAILNGVNATGTPNENFPFREDILWGHNAVTASGTATTVPNNTDDSSMTTVTTTPILNTFLATATTPALLKNPLYYAAKYGNFTDLNNNGRPDLVQEWDNLRLDGSSGADGIPDDYYPVRNPALLEARLNEVLSKIRTRVSAGNAAAVIANSGAGEGALYQAVYRPSVLDATTNIGDSVSWVGILNAFYLDRFGNLRQEDGVSTVGVLDSNDPIIELYYDLIDKRTKFREYDANVDGSVGALRPGGPKELDQLNPIWSAHKELAKVSSYTAQRTLYSDLANAGRYIITAIDQASPTKDGQIKSSAGSTTVNTPEQFAFDTSTFSIASNNHRYLGFDSSATQPEVDNLVNFIRGEEIASSDFRDRTIEFDSANNTDSKGEPWLLGDIVHSSPIAVAAPTNSYDIIYNDSTYRSFKQKYKNRRQMVYVGANDGMVHAFNGGFYDVTNSQFLTSKNGETAHSLGAELWAYIPSNLLPHLQWLKDPTYQHVFYADGTVQSYDVNIFPFSTSNPTAGTYPHGWGTILVVGFRLGGGDYPLDTNGDATIDTTTRSAYVILDITDPEQSPKVLAEITDAELGYTTGEPAVVKFREPNASTGSFQDPATNKWFLVFGSGPAGTDATTKADALENAVSYQDAQVFSLDLDLNSLALSKFATSEVRSFIGGVASVDWNNDYKDDAIYFGTVGNPRTPVVVPPDPTGRLKRGLVSLSGSTLNISFSNLLDVNTQPFSAKPTAVRDPQGKFWVYSGTGRFYVSADNVTSGTQSYYGVKQLQSAGVLTNATVVRSTDLVDTTGFKVFTNGTVLDAANASPVINGTTVTTFQGVKREVEKVSGWVFNFESNVARNTSNGVLSDTSLVFTEYQPSGLQCAPEGTAFLNAPDFQTGIPGPFAPLGTNPSVTNSGGELVMPSVTIGTGSPSAPQIITTADGTKKAIVQLSTGEISGTTVSSGVVEGKRQSWREIPINW